MGKLPPVQSYSAIHHSRCGGARYTVIYQTIDPFAWRREGGGKMANSIVEARHRYAEELRFTAKVGSRAVIDAFATVPRERFFGAGPWRILSPMAIAEYWTTED